MARIAGVNIPDNKHVVVSLTYIYGIGQPAAKKICEKLDLDPGAKVSTLSDEALESVRSLLKESYQVEGDLRREVAISIKRLLDIGCYRGLRHRRHLPSRGQRTRTNARTHKGPKKK